MAPGIAPAATPPNPARPAEAGTRPAARALPRPR